MNKKPETAAEWREFTLSQTARRQTLANQKDQAEADATGVALEAALGDPIAADTQQKAMQRAALAGAELRQIDAVIAAAEQEEQAAATRERQAARTALVPEVEALGERAEAAYSRLLAGLVEVVEAVADLHAVEGEASALASQGGLRHRFTVPRDSAWVGQMLNDLMRGASQSDMVAERQQSAIRQLAEALASGEDVV
ncbi:hypothetical protein [Aeromonas bestiarum]|uniref:hypothetical protein n=1 Tax=Aeromonas bestiarum TaxID=105751 RepID=UPI000507F63B|nr:hypothetical protein [Aeromonas bestiarum]KFN18460.1 hypothetical protein JM66_15195 [Aeromonas bestiarum]